MSNAIGDVAFGLLGTRFFSGFGHGPLGDEVRDGGELLLLASDSLASAAACAGVRAGALASNRKAHPMTTASDTADVLQSLQGHALLTTQITFDGESLGCTTELLDVAILEIFDPYIGIYPGFGQNGFGPCEANSIDICERNFDPLVAGDVNAGDPCHLNSIDGDLVAPHLDAGGGLF